MSHMQDLEEQIMNCWNVVDDMKVYLTADHIEDDRVMNFLIGMAELYQVKFQKLWNTYEAALQDYYDLNKKNKKRERDQMKRFSEFFGEDEDFKSIHLVPNKDGLTYKGRTNRDRDKAYGVLGTHFPARRSVDGKGPEDMKRYHSSIAKDKGFTVHFHEE